VEDVRKDIQKLEVPNWKSLAQDRGRWSWMRRHKLYKRVVEPHKNNPETTYLNFMFKFPTDIPNNNCKSFSATLLL
jgi:hypothetical protein